MELTSWSSSARTASVERFRSAARESAGGGRAGSAPGRFARPRHLRLPRADARPGARGHELSEGAWTSRGCRRSRSSSASTSPRQRSRSSAATRRSRGRLRPRSPSIEDESVTCAWDGLDDAGDKVEPGRYRLRVTLPGQDRVMVFPAPARIVQPGAKEGYELVFSEPCVHGGAGVSASALEVIGALVACGGTGASLVLVGPAAATRRWGSASPRPSCSCSAQVWDEAALRLNHLSARRDGPGADPRGHGSGRDRRDLPARSRGVRDRRLRGAGASPPDSDRR